MTKPLSIVVVGHTNAGKTSLLRTLTRNKNFGEVSHRNATTRHVAQTSVRIAGQSVLHLYDTPGFEESIEFRQYIRQFDELDGRKKILEAFLKSPEASGRFEQQAKVVRVLLDKIDAVFYVIDSTEEPLPKYLSEIDVLSMCAKPVLPILNFVGEAETHSERWSAVLADKGMHIKVSFDAVVPKFGSEALLYSRLGSLLDAHQHQLDEIAGALQKEATERKAAAFHAISDLLIDASAFRGEVSEKDREAIAKLASTMQQKLRAAEQKCVDSLLRIYGFDRSDLADAELPVTSTEPSDDLFDAEAIKAALTRLGLGAAIGAALGLGIDIALVGMSFGVGAAAGGAIGGAVAGYAKEIWDWGNAKVRGLLYFIYDESTLSILLRRQLQLLSVLHDRAHANNQSIELNGQVNVDHFWKELAGPIKQIRVHPAWSRLAGKTVVDMNREEILEKIRGILSKNFAN